MAATTVAPSTPAGSLADELELAVIAFFDSVEAASADPSNAALRDDLADHATGTVLDAFIGALDVDVERNRISLPGPEGFIEVEPYPSTAVQNDDGTAFMQFCVVFWVEVYEVEAGERTLVEAGPHARLGTINFLVDDGVWKLSTIVSTGQFDGEASC